MVKKADARKKKIEANKESLEKISKALAQQPVSNVQWIQADQLTANNYNPNHVAPRELDLLKTSIIEDGWTQPIVIRPDHEIIDGFHRWLLVTQDPDVQTLTGGMIPVVTSRRTELKDQMMSTIRHNRGRGTHAVLKMADIVATLAEEGMTNEEIEAGLGMEDEEVERLKDRGDMLKRGSRDGFNKGKVAV